MSADTACICDPKHLPNTSDARCPQHGLLAFVAGKGTSEPLWDDAFRARLLRHGLSNEEITQAVEAAEAAATERDSLRYGLADVISDIEAGNLDSLGRVLRALREIE